MQLSERQLLKFSEAGTDNPMKCYRCESIMVYEKFTGSTNIFGAGDVSGAVTLSIQSF